MAKGIGRLATVGIAKELSRGTPVASPRFMIAWGDLTVDDKDERALDEQARGVIEGSSGDSIVKQWSEAQIKAPIGEQSLPLIIYSLLGAVGSALAGTGYQHTFTPAQSAQHQSLTLVHDDPLGGQDYAYAMAVPNQVEISYERGQFLSYTADFMAQKGTGTTVTGTAVTEQRFLPQHLTFRVATTLAGLGSGTAIALKSAKVTIKQNVETDDVLGSVAPVDFLNKQFEVEGEVEALWQNESDFKTNALTGTARAIRFDCVNTGLTFGTATSTFQLNCAYVTFKPVTRSFKLNDLVTQTVAFKAHYNAPAGGTPMVQVVVVNAVPTY